MDRAGPPDRFRRRGQARLRRSVRPRFVRRAPAGGPRRARRGEDPRDAHGPPEAVRRLPAAMAASTSPGRAAMMMAAGKGPGTAFVVSLVMIMSDAPQLLLAQGPGAPAAPDESIPPSLVWKRLETNGTSGLTYESACAYD